MAVMHEYLEDDSTESLVKERARIKELMRDAPVGMSCGDADQLSDLAAHIEEELKGRGVTVCGCGWFGQAVDLAAHQAEAVGAALTALRQQDEP